MQQYYGNDEFKMYGISTRDAGRPYILDIWMFPGQTGSHDSQREVSETRQQRMRLF